MYNSYGICYSGLAMLQAPGVSLEKMITLFPDQLGYLAQHPTLAERLWIEGMQNTYIQDMLIHSYIKQKWYWKWY